MMPATLDLLMSADGEAALRMKVPDDFRGTLRVMLESERTMHEDGICDSATLDGDVEAHRTWLMPVVALLDALDDGQELCFPVDGSDSLRFGIEECVVEAVWDGRYADAAIWLALLAEFPKLSNVL